jgi:hypothetical protein
MCTRTCSSYNNARCTRAHVACTSLSIARSMARQIHVHTAKCCVQHVHTFYTCTREHAACSNAYKLAARSHVRMSRACIFYVQQHILRAETRTRANTNPNGTEAFASKNSPTPTHVSCTCCLEHAHMCRATTQVACTCCFEKIFNPVLLADAFSFFGEPFITAGGPERIFTELEQIHARKFERGRRACAPC